MLSPACLAPPRAPQVPHKSHARRVPACRRRLRLAPPHAAASAEPAVGAQQPHGEHRSKRGLLGMLAPFSDPVANAKLLALCTSQMLGSVATLITETYLPLYLSEELRLSHTQIGSLQGSAQLLAKLSGGLSGLVADIVSPARMVLLGTVLSAANKPMYAAAGWVAASGGAGAAVAWIAFAKIFDRVAKGIREAPSKALMGELAAAGGDSPAAAFGLRQSLGTLGALGGALAAGAALRATRGNYSLTFALACAPAAAALALVAAAFGRGSGVGSSAHAVKQAEDQGSVEENGAAPAISSLSPLAKARALAAGLRPAYWQALAVVGILYFSRFDAGFATLRAKSVMPAAALPALIPCMMVPQGILAAPAGLLAKASVRARNRVLLGGMAAMVAADACFAFAPSPAGMVAGALMLGIHMAATHGVSLAMLASYIPAGSLPGLGRIAGTAWSLTDLLLGVVLAASNLLAGRLADTTAARGVGGIGCFLGGAAAATLSAAALLLFSAFGELGLEDALETSNRGGAPAAAAALDAQQQLQDGTGQEQAQFKTG